jgi:hypothetical protein
MRWKNNDIHTKKHPYDKYLKKLRSVIGKDRLDIHNQESGWQTRNRKLQLDDFLNLFVNRRPPLI